MSDHKIEQTNHGKCPENLQLFYFCYKLSAKLFAKILYIFFNINGYKSERLCT